MVRRRDKVHEREIAHERIVRLMDLASEAAASDRWPFAHRYAALARLLTLRHELGTPEVMRERVCRACGAFLVPGATARVRLRKGRRVVTCLACGELRRRALA